MLVVLIHPNLAPTQSILILQQHENYDSTASVMPQSDPSNYQFSSIGLPGTNIQVVLPRPMLENSNESSIHPMPQSNHSSIPVMTVPKTRKLNPTLTATSITTNALKPSELSLTPLLQNTRKNKCAIEKHIPIEKKSEEYNDDDVRFLLESMVDCGYNDS